MSKKYPTKSSQGFTLLEMIVSMGIFTIVAVIAVGSLVRITSLNRQAQSMQAAINNVNYILESMSREMRVGSAYHCQTGAVYNGGDLTFKSCDQVNGDKGILFKSANIGPEGCNLIYGYWFKNDGGTWSIYKSQQKNCNDPISRGDSLSMVDSDNVSITGVEYDVIAGDKNYSRMYIKIAGNAGKKDKERIDFSVRTGISQRIRD